MTKMEVARMIKNKIVEKINPKSIILFGSVISGNEHKDSDIDLLVIWDEKRSYPTSKEELS